VDVFFRVGKRARMLADVWKKINSATEITAHCCKGHKHSQASKIVYKMMIFFCVVVI